MLGAARSSVLCSRSILAPQVPVARSPWAASLLCDAEACLRGQRLSPGQRWVCVEHGSWAGGEGVWLSVRLPRGQRGGVEVVAQARRGRKWPLLGSAHQSGWRADGREEGPLKA